MHVFRLGLYILGNSHRLHDAYEIELMLDRRSIQVADEKSFITDLGLVISRQFPDIRLTYFHLHILASFFLIRRYEEVRRNGGNTID